MLENGEQTAFSGTGLLRQLLRCVLSEDGLYVLG
uniref:Uncharacterized protein n=1 Tax=Anguilla anguilla TaxID=7936 RepID=A0A0E9RHX8_ANGAN